MKKILFLLFALLITFSSAIAQSKSSSDVYVRGYTRKDGTVVPGHYRSAPNSTNRDNFSTRGNTNPYTGKKGWVNPDNKTYITKPSDYSSTGYSSSSNNNNSSTSKATNNFSKPLRVQGENYMYALNKRYVSLKEEIKFFETNTLANLYMNLGVETEGGALVRLQYYSEFRNNNRNYSSKSYKTVTGTLVIYLKNGESIICYDKGFYEKINDAEFSYYKLTAEEVRKLEKIDIELVQFQIRRGDKKLFAPSYMFSSKKILPLFKPFG